MKDQDLTEEAKLLQSLHAKLEDSESELIKMREAARKQARENTTLSKENSALTKTNHDLDNRIYKLELISFIGWVLFICCIVWIGWHLI